MNINFKADINEYRDVIINAFVSEYGEQYRDTITKRFDEINFFTFITLDGLIELEALEKKELMKIKKKIRKTTGDNSDLLQKYDEKLELLEKITTFLDKHYQLRHKILYKHINSFIENNKHYLTTEDQIIWNNTHDLEKLKNLDALIIFDSTIEYSLDIFVSHKVYGNHYHMMPSGLIEYFILDKDNENIKELVEQGIKEYAKIMNKNIDEIEVDIEDIKHINQERHKLIDDILNEYESCFTSYSLNKAKLEKRKSISTEYLNLYNHDTLAFFMPAIVKKGNKFIYSPYISYSPTNGYYNYNDLTFIHEITHAINTNPIKLSNNFKFFCGLELQQQRHKENPPYFHNKEIEVLDEVLNDYIANKITQKLHEQNIYIWQKRKVNSKYKIWHQEFYFLVEPLYNQYKKELIAFFMTGNLKELKEPLSSQIDDLALLANKLLEEYETITDKPTSDYFVNNYKKISRVKKSIKNKAKKYYASIKKKTEEN